MASSICRTSVGYRVPGANLSISDTASIIYDGIILGATHCLSEYCANENIVYTYIHIDNRYG